MSSVTSRIKAIKQPRGGYIPTNSLSVEELNDGKELNKDENIHASLVGLVVDYMSRFLTGTDKNDAFKISLAGSKIIKEENKSKKLLNNINGLNDKSIINACKLVGYDVCYRAGIKYYKNVDEINPDNNTIENISIMLTRSIHFFKTCGQKLLDGITFEGGYTSTITTGDADFMTTDTLWDFKVSNYEPKSDYTLQLLIYYIMGLHSINESYFKQISYLGIYNPRLNKIYRIRIDSISNDIVKEVSDKVICYGKNKTDTSDLLTIQDIMKDQNVTRNTVMKWYTHGDLPLFKKGNRYYINRGKYYMWITDMQERQKKDFRITIIAYILSIIVIAILVLCGYNYLNSVLKNDIPHNTNSSSITKEIHT